MVVFVEYGNRYVEVPDESITLSDICSSFLVDNGVIQDLDSGLIVTTLPSESLPNFSDGKRYRLISKSNEESELLRELIGLGIGCLLSPDDSFYSKNTYTIDSTSNVSSLYPDGAYNPFLGHLFPDMNEKMPYTIRGDKYAGFTEDL